MGPLGRHEIDVLKFGGDVIVERLERMLCRKSLECQPGVAKGKGRGRVGIVEAE